MAGVNPLWLIALSLGIALIPTVIALGTSFLKISIVLSLFRSALGTQQVPGAVITLSLALGMTLVIMQPVFLKIQTQLKALNVTSLAKAPPSECLAALQKVAAPWKEFLVAHSGKKELWALQQLPRESAQGAVVVPPAVGLGVALSAFVLSELRRAFLVGFVIMLPFVAIDLIVANILVGMGMFMVSPMLISLPLKLFLFVVSDGWLLLVQSLLLSYSA